MAFKAPTGSEIRGTVETLPGVAFGGWFDDAATVEEFDHGDETDVGWNGQESETLDGISLFEDQQGREWLEHHLIPEAAPNLSAETIEAMTRELAIAHAYEKLTLANSAILDLANLGVSGAIEPSVDLTTALRQEMLAARTRSIALRKRDLEAKAG